MKLNLPTGATKKPTQKLAQGKRRKQTELIVESKYNKHTRESRSRSHEGDGWVPNKNKHT